MTGKVKWFDDVKGYGFITPDTGGKDVFVHHSEVMMQGRRTLADGQAVEFELADSDRGPKAVRVKPLL